MLDAMESNAKGNDNFATTLISTENVGGKSSSLKNEDEVRRKNQTCLSSKLLPWTASFKVTSAGKLLYFLNFDL